MSHYYSNNTDRLKLCFSSIHKIRLTQFLFLQDTDTSPIVALMQPVQGAATPNRFLVLTTFRENRRFRGKLSKNTPKPPRPLYLHFSWFITADSMFTILSLSAGRLFVLAIFVLAFPSRIILARFFYVFCDGLKINYYNC